MVNYNRDFVFCGKKEQKKVDVSSNVVIHSFILSLSIYKTSKYAKPQFEKQIYIYIYIYILRQSCPVGHTVHHFLIHKIFFEI